VHSAEDELKGGDGGGDGDGGVGSVHSDEDKLKDASNLDAAKVHDPRRYSTRISRGRGRITDGGTNVTTPLPENPNPKGFRRVLAVPFTGVNSSRLTRSTSGVGVGAPAGVGGGAGGGVGAPAGAGGGGSGVHDTSLMTPTGNLPEFKIAFAIFKAFVVNPLLSDVIWSVKHADDSKGLHSVLSNTISRTNQTYLRSIIDCVNEIIRKYKFIFVEWDQATVSVEGGSRVKRSFQPLNNYCSEVLKFSKEELKNPILIATGYILKVISEETTSASSKPGVEIKLLEAILTQGITLPGINFTFSGWAVLIDFSAEMVILNHKDTFSRNENLEKTFYDNLEFAIKHFTNEDLIEINIPIECTQCTVTAINGKRSASLNYGNDKIGTSSEISRVNITSALFNVDSLKDMHLGRTLLYLSVSGKFSKQTPETAKKWITNRFEDLRELGSD